MCGLTGWVSYQRDLTRYPETAAAMTETMACRGPDAEGVWTAPRVVLGHRRLAVIDLEGGRQPMVAADEDGAVQAVISYTGEVYNFQELRAELRRRGHTFGTASDTEVVLRAYLEWGESFVERLNGMYAFAIWDTRTEELLLVRDRMGVKPLYYYPTEDGVLFGSEPKAILANPLAERVVQADGLREIFSMIQTPEQAIFRGMFEVRPGSLVRVARAGLTKTRYWQLQARPHTDDLDTTVRTVRELLEDIVARQLVADVPLCTLLSGGLDSSAVTALAAKAMAEQGGERLRAFSIDFSGHSSRFQSNVQWEDPDTPYAAEVGRHVGAEHINILLDNADVLDPAVRQATLRAQDLPVTCGDMEFSLYLLSKRIRAHSTVALSGEAADELFGGYTWFHDAAATEADTFPWHHPFEKGGGIGALRTLGLWDRLELAGHVKCRYAEALDEVPRLPGETGTEARMRELTYLNLTRFENFLLNRKDRISMAVGLEVRVPFCDHRLVEYVYNVPWAMKNFDGREKSLLRAAMADALPKSVLNRKKNPYPSTQDLRYEVALRERVRQLLARDAPALQLATKSGIRAMLDAPTGSYGVGGPWTARGVLERLLEFDAWVTEYDVRVEP